MAQSVAEKLEKAKNVREVVVAEVNVKNIQKINAGGRVSTREI